MHHAESPTHRRLSFKGLRFKRRLGGKFLGGVGLACLMFNRKFKATLWLVALGLAIGALIGVSR